LEGVKLLAQNYHNFLSNAKLIRTRKDNLNFFE